MMQSSINTISRKITLLNQTVLDSMMEKTDRAIVKNFIETGIKILEADFGFAWWRSNEDTKYKLAYKSQSTPFDPPLPRARAGNYIARTTKKPFFDSEVKTESYDFKIRKYLKSYIIIPTFYKDDMYGNLVFCYKNKRLFTKDELALSLSIGNAAAQSLTIHQLVETDILLNQEKIKTEFIANATHELRTPLAIMKGNLDLALLNEGNLKLAKSALKAISLEIKILSEILKDLALLTSSEENAENVLEQTSVNVYHLLEQVAFRLKTEAFKKKINIKLTKKRSNGFSVYGDAKYLEKLFLNLIKNAITYGKEGGNIFINIIIEKNLVTIKVKDDGIGISKEDLPKIFERFFRADKAHGSYAHHSGLGLPIARWVAEIHGGHIDVESTEGKGSTFTVTLPVGKKN